MNGSAATNCDIRLVPDSNATATASNIANYRRFILQCTNPAAQQISFEGGSGDSWYGVIEAPYGLTMGSYTAETFVNGVAVAGGNAPLSASITWHGTILIGQSVGMTSPGGPLNLTISPDDGAGTSNAPATDSYSNSSSCYWLFTPQPNPTVNAPIMGRPMPILVPRMVWNFENETTH